MKCKLERPLPIRNGVSPSFVWLPPGNWCTVLEFLVQRFSDVRMETWLKRMAQQELVDASGSAITAHTPYCAGHCLFYYRELNDEQRIPGREQVLYRDERLLIVDKPHFLPVIPSGRYLHETLLVRLKNEYGFEQLAPMHRLDRETAGVVAFTLDATVRGVYQRLFEQQQVMKTYEAVAATSNTLIFPLCRRSRIVDAEPFYLSAETTGECNAETRIDVLRAGSELSLYKLMPLSGKKHQLRVHMAALGLPILNDRWYGPGDKVDENDFSQPLQLLARSLSFVDPVTGVLHEFFSQRELALTVV